MSQEILSERSQQLLKYLIQRYIRDGQPVGSKTLAQESGLSLSPATIRHVMADLEEHGYIVSPHTSAGRVPTSQGYRLFVDGLLSVEPVADSHFTAFQSRINPDMTTQELMESTSLLLSAITRQAGVVTLPKRELLQLRQVEFLPLSGSRVLVILVVNEKEVQNRIIHTRREYSREELVCATNFINRNYAGKPLREIKAALIDEMQADKDQIDHMMQAVIDVAGQAFQEQQGDCVVAGQGNLLDSAEPDGIVRLRELFEAFQQKKSLLHLMERCAVADGVQIYIGDESGYQVLDDYSVITAPYRSGDSSVGVLGVIGPTRMAYERVIPVVDMTARVISMALDRHKA
jgi:heat-inducible transcriptional repressor